MKYSDKQFENVAIYLDGGDITLSQEELKLAGEISRDQHAVSAWLDDPSTIPGRKPITAPKRPMWQKTVFTTLAAAASIAIVATIAVHLIAPPKPHTTTRTTNGETAGIIESIAEIDLIEQQQQEAEFATLLLEQQNSVDDPVAEDISANADQWFQALSSSDQQGLLTPELNSDCA